MIFLNDILPSIIKGLKMVLSTMFSTLIENTCLRLESCMDPESFVRGSPTLTGFFASFLVDEGISRAIIGGPPAKRHLMVFRGGADDD